MNWRDAVICEAKTWLNTPYHSGAGLKGIGVDCGWLLIRVYESAGVVPVGDCDPGPYSPEWHLHRNEEKYLMWIQKYCEITESEPLPGDIAVFRFGRCISHGAIVLAWPRIIHAYVGMGVIMSDITESILLHPNGESRLCGIYRPKGVWLDGRNIR